MKTLVRPSLAVLAFSIQTLVSAVADTPAPAGLWAQLYSADPARYAANLRAAGCPEDTVGLLVSQAINTQFAEKERALQASTRSEEGLRNFWAPGRRDAWLQVQKQKSDALRAVLGAAPDQRARTDWVASHFPRLNREQRDTVRMITEDYDQLVQRVMSVAQGSLLDEDRDMLQFLGSEREKDLAAVLTRDEVIEYQILRSTFGAYLRHRLACFEPTPQELRTCYELGVRHGLAVEIANLNFDRQREAQLAVEEELAKVWPPERFASYRRAQSIHFSRTFNLVRRLGKPRQIADQLFDSQVAMSEAAMRIVRVPSRRVVVTSTSDATGGAPARPDAKAMSAQLRAERVEQTGRLLDQHMALVQSLLGDDGFKAYYETHQWWIDRMRDGAVINFQPSSTIVRTSSLPVP